MEGTEALAVVVRLFNSAAAGFRTLPDNLDVEMPRFLDDLAAALVLANSQRHSPRYLAQGDSIVLLVGQGKASRLLTAAEKVVRAELRRDIRGAMGSNIDSRHLDRSVSRTLLPPRWR